jgi:hypothetical protein
MRNDARPIGEKLRDIDEHAHQERGSGSDQGTKPRMKDMKNERKPFVTGRDTGDEEATKPPARNRM